MTGTPDAPLQPPSQTGALVRAAQAGDVAAQDELLQRNLPRLRAFVRLRADRFLRARESHSDLVQSTCREVLGSLDKITYENEDLFRGWLYTIVANKLREKARFHRAARRDPDREAPELEDPDALVAAYSAFVSPSQHAVGAELAVRIEAAFEQLDADHREVITLSRLAGLSTAAIAQRMERSEQAVRSLLSRALVRLSALLDARD
jgi:RNA polymerase sigma-70 factor (ECF subfamily)